MKRRFVVVSAVVLLVCIGCLSGNQPEHSPQCTPGEVQECPCLGGETGVQICQSDGTWGTCEGCTPVGDAVGDPYADAVAPCNKGDCVQACCKAENCEKNLIMQSACILDCTENPCLWGGGAPAGDVADIAPPLPQDVVQPPEDAFVPPGEEVVKPPEDTVTPPEDTVVRPPDDAVVQPPEDTVVSPPEDVGVPEEDWGYYD